MATTASGPTGPTLNINGAPAIVALLGTDLKEMLQGVLSSAGVRRSEEVQVVARRVEKVDEASETGLRLQPSPERDSAVFTWRAETRGERVEFTVKAPPSQNITRFSQALARVMRDLNSDAAPKGRNDKSANGKGGSNGKGRAGIQPQELEAFFEALRADGKILVGGLIPRRHITEAAQKGLGLSRENVTAFVSNMLVTGQIRYADSDEFYTLGDAYMGYAPAKEDDGVEKEDEVERENLGGPIDTERKNMDAQPGVSFHNDLSVPLPDRVKMFLAARSLDPKTLARLCGCRIGKVNDVLNGREIGEFVAIKIEGVLAGAGPLLNGTDHQFDPTMEGLIEMIFKLAGGGEGLNGLLEEVFGRWRRVKSPEDVRSFIETMLRDYLAAEEPGDRLESLLKLRDNYRGG